MPAGADMNMLERSARTVQDRLAALQGRITAHGGRLENTVTDNNLVSWSYRLTLPVGPPQYFQNLGMLAAYLNTLDRADADGGTT